MPPHFLRCQGLAVNDYSVALGRLETWAPSTFAQLGYNHVNSPVIKYNVDKRQT